METRKVVVRVKKIEALPEKTKSEKQIRYEARIAERKAKKKPSKTELLESEGKRFVNFVVDVEMFNKWASVCESKGIKPNERFTEIVIQDTEVLNER